MDGMITADHVAFRVAVADVRRVAGLLRQDRDRVAREVDGLLDGGWRGTAASSYAAAWTDWTRAAETVLTGLSAMAELLSAADARLVDSDLAAGSALEVLTARLG
jgi:WXG100 family type VII secretion target